MISAERASRLHLTRPLVLIALLFVAAGLLHIVVPEPYIRTVPSWLPSPATLVLVSGICQIVGGLGVILPATRVAAAWGLIALMVAVFPANVEMLLDSHADGESPLWQAALVARLPVQAALIWWVWRNALRSRRVSAAWRASQRE